MMHNKNVMDIFKAVVVSKANKLSGPKLLKINGQLYPVVVDFHVPEHDFWLKDVLDSSEIQGSTLFSVEERENANMEDLITKQLLSYFETYGLGAPGLFNLEVSQTVSLPVTYVRGVTKAELGQMVLDIMYTNAPVKNAIAFKNIIDTFDIQYDINKVKNNELKVLLFNPDTDTFQTGDDFVRYLCYLATDNALLIKSRFVLNQISALSTPLQLLLRSPQGLKLFERHQLPLAQVFNRHKPIILAVKAASPKKCGIKSVINKISRMSKKNHVPLIPPINKTFISKALNRKIELQDALANVSIRDKFNYLNLLEWKRNQFDTDTFFIRNGKMFIKENRPIYDKDLIDCVKHEVIKSFDKQFVENLKKKKILLDANVKLGLPISRKKSLGQLPYGTRVSIEGDSISSGIFWKNKWGARDLDLSCICRDGSRIGWGAGAAYTGKNIVYSGDIVGAANGAMEFITSNLSETYGLFVNIYSGNNGCTADIVVGNKTKAEWIENVIFRENVTLSDKYNMIGVVHKGEFVVYGGNIGSNSISDSKSKIFINQGASDIWTLNRFLTALGVGYITSTEVPFSNDVDVDLTYGNYTYDKLEELLLK